MDTAFLIVVRILEVIFAIGVAGCVVTIPLVAYRMFSVLLERDSPEE